MASVVFMGTPDFAAGILRSVIDSGYEVKAVFTQPDRPKGRKGLLQMPPVKALAIEEGIEVYQPGRIREEENAQILRRICPDFIVVAAFGQIIPQEILDIPRHGCLNVHASLLPAWRGAAPIQWAILSGDRVTGVTIMRMDAGLDTGDMILKREVPIREDETGDSLFDVLMDAGCGLLLEAMRRIEAGCAEYTPQPKESPTPYARMLERRSGLIDWSLDAAQIARMVRAFDSWPGTYTFFNGRMLKILKARALEADQTQEDAKVPSQEGDQVQQDAKVPAQDSGKAQEAAKVRALEGDQAQQAGKILAAKGADLIVQTGSGLLRILEVQPEGKKRMEADAFLRGYRPQPGEGFRDAR